MDLPPLPCVRSRLERGRAARAHLQLGAGLASRRIRALQGHGPYLVVLVELPDAGNVRMVGNLLGDPMQDVAIGAEVEGVFEHHEDAAPPYSLLQWRCIQPG